MLKLENVSVAFASRNGGLVHALDRISFEIGAGEFCVALGASGCGKSTLLNVIAGFLAPSAGVVSLDGTKVQGPGADRGVVFQSDSLLPWKSVSENVALGLKFAGLPKRQRREAAHELLNLVGLAKFADAAPYELSGGMRQRVGIARALARDPAILLMDEPFGALDSLTRENMQLLLQKVWTRTAKRIFLITHSIEEALLLGTEILVMTPRPGRITARYCPAFARRLAAGDDYESVRVSPEFVQLHAEIRARIHGVSHD